MVREDGDTPSGQEGVVGPYVLLKNLLTDARVIKADSEDTLVGSSGSLSDTLHVSLISWGDDSKGGKEVEALVCCSSGGVLGYTNHNDSLAPRAVITRDKA